MELRIQQKIDNHYVNMPIKCCKMDMEQSLFIGYQTMPDDSGISMQISPWACLP